LLVLNTTTNNDLQVRGSENEIRRITYADNPNVTRGVVRTSSILKSLHLFLLTRKRLTENCLGQSKGSWKVMGAIKKAFVMMTGTGGSVNNKDAEDVLLIQEVLTSVINEWGQETGIFIPAFLKYGEPGNLAVCLTLS
jgi:hypothetical protein